MGKHGSMPNSEFLTFLNKNHPTLARHTGQEEVEAISTSGGDWGCSCRGAMLPYWPIVCQPCLGPSLMASYKGTISISQLSSVPLYALSLTFMKVCLLNKYFPHFLTSLWRTRYQDWKAQLWKTSKIRQFSDEFFKEKIPGLKGPAVENIKA